jgi:hypothetical protein
MRYFGRWGAVGVRSRRCLVEPLESRYLLSVVPPKVVDVEVASTSWTAGFLEFVQDNAEESRGYSVPFGAAQLNSLTWTNIDQIILRFSEDVYIDSADLSISGVNTTAYQFGDFHYDPIDHVAIWTLAAPLDKDRFQLDLDANGEDPVRDLAGNTLDGEWVNKVSTVSGNGTAGGDFQFTFHVQPTDVDNNGRITSNDYALIYQLNGKTIADSTYKAARDVDGNGVINTLDWQEAIDRYFEQRPIGNPAGANNDAPTADGFDLIEISDTANDTAISLAAQFGDTENGGNSLSYTILSYSNQAVFDSIAINQTTKQLVVNAADSVSGRSTVVVRATDANGLTVDAAITIDVNYENQQPVIEDLVIATADFDTWIVSGRVTDSDDDVSNFIINFSGVFTIRSAVDEEGYFLFAIILEPGQCGEEEVVTIDPHGLASLTHYRDVGDLT